MSAHSADFVTNREGGTNVGENRVALVTGASRGIGRAIAETLAGAGYTVAGVARGSAQFDGATCHPYACDVSDTDAVGHLVRRISEDFGRIDVLINCAGILKSERFERMTRADMAAQIGVNLWGVINMTQACLAMLKASRGKIVNVSSTLSQRPIPGISIYAATKGAVEAFTRALAVELGDDGVRVMAVQPAIVRSDIWIAAGMNPAAYAALMAARALEYPLGRIGEPQDVANLVAYLVSDGASWLTGVCIPVDGGSSVGHMRR
jgi:NAD(P)-dependent dehydrogenase (short-subunit alcohol dehydrogenase family)